MTMTKEDRSTIHILIEGKPDDKIVQMQVGILRRALIELEEARRSMVEVNKACTREIIVMREERDSARAEVARLSSALYDAAREQRV